jgi:hypothetical protein
MAISLPVRLFHITAIANLPNIFANGTLLSKNCVAANRIAYANIAHQGAQGARSAKAVPNPPGGNIHDYVPFYFAPRSPMLYAINAGRVLGCDLRQADIVHLETTVDLALTHKNPYVIYDRNATKPYSTPYTSLDGLNSVAWDLITETPSLDGYCKYFHDVPSNVKYVDRMEKRMAEFLVKNHVPLAAITRIGVLSNAQQEVVRQMVSTCGLAIPVAAIPTWYF